MYRNILLLIFITCSLHSQETYKIALGSCLHQDYPAPIWNAVKENNIDSFFFLGDNIYGDVPSGLPWKLKRSYDKQKKVLPSWLMSKEIHMIGTIMIMAKTMAVVLINSKNMLKTYT